jgi:hypothetical protein
VPRLSIILIVVSVAIAAVEPALAQQPVPAPPTIGGVFGGRTPPDPAKPDRSSQELTFSVDAAGGYDWTPRGTALAGEIQQAGNIVASSATLGHRWGSRETFVESFARGNVSLAETGVEQQESAQARIQGSLPFGRRAGMTVDVSASYEPTYLFNAYGSLAPQMADGIVPGAALDEGFTTDRWLVGDAAARLHRNWTTRQRTDLLYSASRRDGVEPRRVASRRQASGVRHEWSYSERASLFGEYQFSENREYANAIDATPMPAHRANVGLRLNKSYPRSRAITLSLGGGATRTRTRATLITAPADFVVPSARFGLHSRFSTAWTMSLDATRDVTMLEGISPRQFITDAGALSLNGELGEVELTTTAAYSRGVAPDGGSGEFETMVGRVNLQFPLTRMFGMSGSYGFYRHHLVDLPEVATLLPRLQRRHSVRIGIHLWLPLFGTF